MYVIISGRMRVFHIAEGEEIPLSTLEKGAFFGEMALIDGEPRSAGVRALVSCELIESALGLGTSVTVRIPKRLREKGIQAGQV